MSSKKNHLAWNVSTHEKAPSLKVAESPLIIAAKAKALCSSKGCLVTCDLRWGVQLNSLSISKYFLSKKKIIIKVFLSFHLFNYLVTPTTCYGFQLIPQESREFKADFICLHTNESHDNVKTSST